MDLCRALQPVSGQISRRPGIEPTGLRPSDAQAPVEQYFGRSLGAIGQGHAKAKALRTVRRPDGRRFYQVSSAATTRPGVNGMCRSRLPCAA